MSSLPPPQIRPATLKKTLTSRQLWGLAVGLVISGQYFGWSYGWANAGTLGFLVTTALVALMYIAFILSFSELAAAIPNSGGPFAYAYRAFGEKIAFIAGFATLVEFVFAPPAIALAIGAYINVQTDILPPATIACLFYLLFMLLNIFGIGFAATLELIITLLAVFELCVFMGVVSSGFKLSNFLHQGWAGFNTFNAGITLPAVFAAAPFAIWFFLGIEGASMVSEEVKNPQHTIPRAFISGIITLVLLSFGVMIVAGGSGDWRLLADINDPLPRAMLAVVGTDSLWSRMLVCLGLFGLIASFHGLMIGYSRQIYALARAHYLPAFLGKLSYRFKTPYIATAAGGIIGMAAIFSENFISFGGQPLTANIVTLAVLGALTMYIISLLSLYRLRRREPRLIRPYLSPGYPWLPLTALILAFIFLLTVINNNPTLTLVFVLLLMTSYLSRRLYYHWHRGENHE